MGDMGMGPGGFDCQEEFGGLDLDVKLVRIGLYQTARSRQLCLFRGMKYRGIHGCCRAISPDGLYMISCIDNHAVVLVIHNISTKSLRFGIPPKRTQKWRKARSPTASTTTELGPFAP